MEVCADVCADVCAEDRGEVSADVCSEVKFKSDNDLFDADLIRELYDFSEVKVQEV